MNILDLRDKVTAILIYEVTEKLREANYIEDPIIVAGNTSDAWVFPGARLSSANQAAVISLGATWYGIAVPLGSIQTSRKVKGKKQITSQMTEAVHIFTCVDGDREGMTIYLNYDDARKFVCLGDKAKHDKPSNDERHDLFAFNFKDDVSLREQIQEIKATIFPMMKPILREIDLRSL